MISRAEENIKALEKKNLELVKQFQEKNEAISDLNSSLKDAYERETELKE